MDSLHIQSRIVAPDPDTAAEMVREKLERRGHEVERLRMWPCPVQCYPNMLWLEWIARVKQVNA